MEPGKPSIISTIITLEKATSGGISVKGMDVVKNERDVKAITGVVPQEVVTHGYFNVEEILRFQSGYYGFMGNKKKIQDLMRQLDLWDHRHKKVRQLSGGMKRRLMIAKALSHSPQLLLLDEPTAGVDVDLRYSIWKQVRELKKTGVAVLFTTHYLEEAEQLCDRVAIIHKGKIRKQGDTKELVQKLTSRHLTLILKDNIQCSHSALVRQQGNTWEFRVPYSIEMGRFLSDLDVKRDNILDMKIREGTLEEAFKYVLDQEGL